MDEQDERRDEVSRRDALARFDAEMRQLEAEVVAASAARHPRVIAASAARHTPGRARRPLLTRPIGSDCILAAVKHRNVGKNSRKVAQDAVAAQHGDPLAAIRLRLAARAPLPVRRLRPPACRPARRVVRIRPRERRATTRCATRAGPARPEDPDRPLELRAAA